MGNYAPLSLTLVRAITSPYGEVLRASSPVDDLLDLYEQGRLAFRMPLSDCPPPVGVLFLSSVFRKPAKQR